MIIKDSTVKNQYVFVVGNSRSGTTMMGRIICQHPTALPFGELHYFEQLWSSADRGRTLSPEKAQTLLMRLFTIQQDGYLLQGNPLRFKDEVNTLLNSLFSNEQSSIDLLNAFFNWLLQKEKKSIACEKTPRNVFYIKEILEFFPQARIVNMIRDPRDVLLSQKNKWKRRFLGGKGSIPMSEAFRSWVNYHPITISRLWNASIQAADEYQNHDRVHHIYFEKLISNPKKEVNDLCDFLKIDFSPGMLKVPQMGSSSGHDHPEKKGINANATGRWQKGGLSKVEIDLCQKMTYQNMKKHGYPATNIKAFFLFKLLSYLTFPFKIGFALLLNLGRMRNMIESFQRRFR